MSSDLGSQDMAKVPEQQQSGGDFGQMSDAELSQYGSSFIKPSTKMSKRMMKAYNLEGLQQFSDSHEKQQSSQLAKDSSSGAQAQNLQGDSEVAKQVVFSLAPNDGSFAAKKLVLSLEGSNVQKIGRQSSPKQPPAADNLIFDSKVLSRAHAEVYYDREVGSVMIRDCGSSNGTFVNGERLSQEGKPSDKPRQLKGGDILEFGVDIFGDDGVTVLFHKVSCTVGILNPYAKSAGEGSASLKANKAQAVDESVLDSVLTELANDLNVAQNQSVQIKKLKSALDDVGALVDEKSSSEVKSSVPRQQDEQFLEQISKLKVEITDLEMSLNESQSDKENLKQEIDQLKQQHSQILQEQQSQLNQELFVATQKIEQLNQKLIPMAADLDSIRAQLAEKQSEVSQLQQQLQEKQNLHAQSESDLSSMRSENEDKIMELKGKIIDEQTKKNQLIDENSQLSLQLKELTSAKNAVARQFNDVQQQLADTQKSLQSFELKFQEVSTEKEALAQQNRNAQDLQQLAEQQKETITKLQNDLKDTESKLLEIEEAFKVALADVGTSQDVDKLLKEISSIKAQQDQLESETISLSKQLQDAKEENALNKSQLQQQKKLAEELKQQLFALKAEEKHVVQQQPSSGANVGQAIIVAIVSVAISVFAMKYNLLGALLR
ncbi:hypothetical protein MIR68_003158 [Amoeboaphelidium protococcarum]|nr:hypothetical protein MIR68_003158 [Amoeboaphelidium protococcarum]